MNIFFLFVTILSFSFSVFGAESGSKVCVINFERPESGVTKIVENALLGHDGVTIYSLATPMDFLNCIKNDSTEIVIIGHAIITPDNQDGKKPVNLGYFRNLEGEEREKARSSIISELSKEITDLERNNFVDDGIGQENLTPITKKIRDLKDTRKQYIEFRDDQPYYVIRPVLKNIMVLAQEELSKKAGPIQLKKIRLMSCLSDQVMAEYDDFRQLIEENNIELDIAPTNKFLSFFKGMNVSTPDPNWLKESLP
jgi:hypothetical protein